MSHHDSVGVWRRTEDESVVCLLTHISSFVYIHSAVWNTVFSGFWINCFVFSLPYRNVALCLGTELVGCLENEIMAIISGLHYEVVLKPDSGWISHFCFPLSGDSHVTVTRSSVRAPGFIQNLFVICLRGLGRGRLKLQTYQTLKYYDWRVCIFRTWSFVHFFVLVFITSDFWHTISKSWRLINNYCGLWKRNILFLI